MPGPSRQEARDARPIRPRRFGIGGTPVVTRDGSDLVHLQVILCMQGWDPATVSYRLTSRWNMPIVTASARQMCIGRGIFPFQDH
jgi:hypothetical protein